MYVYTFIILNCKLNYVEAILRNKIRINDK